MSIVPFNTLKYANTLKAGGFSEQQAEAEALALADVLDVNLKELATKTDLASTERLLKTDLAKVESALKADIASTERLLKADIANTERLLKADIANVEAALKADISELRLMIKGLCIAAGAGAAWLAWLSVKLMAIAEKIL